MVDAQVTPLQVHRAALRARRLAREERGLAVPPVDRFAEPAVFPTGVEWRPSCYRSMDQGRYLEYAARRTLPS